MHIRHLIKPWILNQQQTIDDDVIIQYIRNIVTIGMMVVLMMIIVIMMVVMIKVIIMVLTVKKLMVVQIIQ